MDSIIIISIVAFVGVTALVAAVAFALRDYGSTTAEERLAVITGQKSAEDKNTGVMKDEMFKEGMSGLNGMFNSLMGRLLNMQLLFEQADSPIQANGFFGLTALLGLLGVAGAIIAGAPIPLYPVGGLMAASLPLLWMLWRRKSRFKKFANQLPDALELIARALRSGHSLNSGLQVVVDEMPSPTSEEFAMAYEEQNLGIPIEVALKNMLNRMPNMDLKFFVTAVVIQKQAGGDMAEILDKIGRIIRERFKIMGQVQALTGEGRISGIVLMALPIALLIAVYYLNPPYVMLLFTEELGRQMIAVAAVLQVLGAITIKKIIAIKI
ncbi:Flp pilus assembly protein TadB [hydrothermal vent metagenome]|uniref:Flp pilus assembly protein TadB n=1 Tax=hydrothermal vent metagenome TaxID=652676 RepID=A0A3B1DST5_9ZZZZ